MVYCQNLVSLTVKKVTRVILFFVVVFTVYSAANGYVLLRAFQAFPAGSPVRVWVLVVGIVLALSVIAGRVLERVWLSSLSDVLVWIGSFWLGFLLYAFLSVLMIDLLRVLNLVIPFFPAGIVANPERAARMTFMVVGCFVAVLCIAGHVNARIPRIHTMALHIPKNVDGPPSLRIVLASDIHLGTIIGRKRLESIVSTIASLKPDLVLFPGDLVDEDLGPVLAENTGEAFRSLHARLGVYGITGNHEYIGGAEEAVAYLEDHGVRMLRDTTVTLDGGITLVGREDRSIAQFAGGVRKPLARLLEGVPRDRPVILMDHQPFHLAEAETLGVDLQVSGHTHHGQLWPFNFITRAVYEQSRGYLRKGLTHYYVSSGVGTWGPPMRLGNRPEIVELLVTFGSP